MATIRKDAPALIDEYIAAMPDFLKEICVQLRQIIHKADPEILEDWKWGPNFNKNGMICGFWPTRKYIKFTFYRGAELEKNFPVFNHCTDNENNRSIKYTHRSEINEKEIIRCIRAAVKLNASGPRKVARDKTITLPGDLKKQLSLNPAAQKHFNSFTYYKQKEYVEWIGSAKREETRARRLAITLQKLEKGIGFNDKYRDS